MLEQQLTIVNKLGLHARAAAKLVKLSSTFKASIELQKDDKRVNCKSIMGVMMLAAGRGSAVKLYAEGPDEEAALNAVLQLIENRFGEDE